MTSNSEFILLKKMLSQAPFRSLSISKALQHIQTKSKVIQRRQRNSTDIKLYSAIFESQAIECNKILKEIKC